MKLEGRLYVGNHIVSLRTVEQDRPELRLVKQLESLLIELCHEMDVPIPLWLEKNTREFARFHQTIFFAESFTDPVKFDRFQIRWDRE